MAADERTRAPVAARLRRARSGAFQFSFGAILATVCRKQPADLLPHASGTVLSCAAAADVAEFPQASCPTDAEKSTPRRAIRFAPRGILPRYVSGGDRRSLGRRPRPHRTTRTVQRANLFYSSGGAR